MSYINSFFSLKKFFYKNVSFFAIWDSKSTFTQFSEIRRFSKLKNSVVGKYSRVNPGCKLANTIVGNFTAIGRDTTIGLGQHPLNYVSTQNIFYKKNNLKNNWIHQIDFSSKPIIIGNDVWIGVESLIMDGVKIGDGAVIGARSVVTKDVPPYAIVVGQPAKIIKFRFENDVIERLLEIKWWNFSDEEISDMIYFFREPNVTIEIINKYFPI
jgi:acetyltransferase-like isoleucine patch superfamily enzyme